MSDLGSELRETFGDIDIYVFDQIARGRVSRSTRVLDAACGDGRNIEYLLRKGIQVFGVDADAARIEDVQSLVARVAPDLPAENFRVERVEAMSFADESFDFVIASAVLHFAEDEDMFSRMLQEIWRVTKSGGAVFARLASSIGIEDRIQLRGGHRYGLPDGTDRFLVDEPYLLEWTERLGARLLDPLKTTNVQGKRCMTTWVIEKIPSRAR